MGLLDFAKKQFIEVIQWTEQGDGVLAFRYPTRDQEIKNGAQLTVRETQIAMFVNEGKVADVFQPGLYTLNTKTLPILTYLKNWDKAFQSPFKSDVYYFSTREQIDQKWGTPNPITIRDKEFGPIRLRASGNYAYKIADPKVFFAKISGTRDHYTVLELEGQLRSILMTSLGHFIGGGEIPFVDMAADQMAFSTRIKEGIAKDFLDYGLELTKVFVQTISLPEELQERFDKASSMRIVGDMPRYAQFQTAESIPLAASNSGGLAGAGAGMGAGVAIGQSMAAAMGGMNASSGTSVDAMATIDRLYELVKKGALSQAEFDAKKIELLKTVR